MTAAFDNSSTPRPYPVGLARTHAAHQDREAAARATHPAPRPGYQIPPETRHTAAHGPHCETCMAWTRNGGACPGHAFGTDVKPLCHGDFEPDRDRIMQLATEIPW